MTLFLVWLNWYSIALIWGSEVDFPFADKTHTHEKTHTKRHRHKETHNETHTHEETHTKRHTRKDRHKETHTKRHRHKETHEKTHTLCHKHTHQLQVVSPLPSFRERGGDSESGSIFGGACGPVGRSPRRRRRLAIVRRRNRARFGSNGETV